MECKDCLYWTGDPSLKAKQNCENIKNYATIGKILNDDKKLHCIVASTAQGIKVVEFELMVDASFSCKNFRQTDCPANNLEGPLISLFNED